MKVRGGDLPVSSRSTPTWAQAVKPGCTTQTNHGDGASARPYYHQASAPGAEDRLAPKTWGLRRISKTSVTAIATTATMAAPTAG